MAYRTFGYAPRKSYGEGVAQQALTRWLNTQKEAKGMFMGAEKPLQESVQMFQPGGGYGQGQAQLLQDQARQAQAEALSSQVATGMSSGSLATSTGLRVKKDLAQGLAGVEDTRTQFLTQALQSLSGLRGQRAQTLSATSDPVFAPYLSYLGRGGGGGSNQMNVAQTPSQPRSSMAGLYSSMGVPYEYSLGKKAVTSSGYRNPYDSSGW